MPCGWGVKARMLRAWVTAKTVLSPHLSALEIKGLYIKCYINSSVHFTFYIDPNWATQPGYPATWGRCTTTSESCSTACNALALYIDTVSHCKLVSGWEIWKQRLVRNPDGPCDVENNFFHKTETVVVMQLVDKLYNLVSATGQWNLWCLVHGKIATGLDCTRHALLTTAFQKYNTLCYLSIWQIITSHSL